MSTSHRQQPSTDTTRRIREQRKSPRQHCEVSVALSVLKSDGEFTDPMLVKAVDISVDGIAILTTQMVRSGTAGALHLRIPGRRTAIIGVEAVNCAYIGDMKHRIGLRFTALHESFAGSPSMMNGSRILERESAHQSLRRAVA